MIRTTFEWQFHSTKAITICLVCYLATRLAILAIVAMSRLFMFMYTACIYLLNLLSQNREARPFIATQTSHWDSLSSEKWSPNTVLVAKFVSARTTVGKRGPILAS